MWLGIARVRWLCVQIPSHLELENPNLTPKTPSKHPRTLEDSCCKMGICHLRKSVKATIYDEEFDLGKCNPQVCPDCLLCISEASHKVNHLTYKSFSPFKWTLFIEHFWIYRKIDNIVQRIPIYPLHQFLYLLTLLSCPVMRPQSGIPSFLLTPNSVIYHFLKSSM